VLLEVGSILGGDLIGLMLWMFGCGPSEPVPVEEPVVAAATPLQAPVDRVLVDLKIRPGTSLGLLLQPWGVHESTVRGAALELYDLSRIRPDRSLTVGWEEGASGVNQVRYAIDQDNVVVARLTNGAWSAEMESVEYTGTTELIQFSITHSLWADGLGAGLRPADLPELARVFEYTVDFNTELHPNATFDIVAEVLRAPGRPQKLGDVRAIRLTNAGETYEAVGFLVGENVNYYTPEGKAFKRPFLRSPLEFSRVTSGFNPKRYHPVLKKVRPHNGTDFGAPTGTSVRTVGDGRVVFAGRNGGHGNFVKIDHGNGYVTSYSHLSRISVSKGSRVKQGQIVGKVGATGLATGPHLHYQMWKNGRFVDALKVKVPTMEPLPKAQMPAFQEQAGQWLPMLP